MSEERPQRKPQGDRPKKRDVNGWIVLDKGVGMTSTHAVAVVKRGSSASMAAGSGILSVRSTTSPSVSSVFVSVPQATVNT